MLLVIWLFGKYMGNMTGLKLLFVMILYYPSTFYNCQLGRKEISNIEVNEKGQKEEVIAKVQTHPQIPLPSG